VANSFNDVGFLGDDLDGWRDSVHAEFPESFAIADRMNRIGMRMMREFHFDDPTEAQLLAVAAFFRSLQSFQSTILLAERGALPEARSLARLCCEAVILMGGLLKVEGTVEKLHEDHAKHCMSLANSMVHMNRDGNTGVDLTPFEQEVAKVMVEYPNKPHSIVWSSLAVQAGLAKLFELAYRFPSGDGAHMTLAALHRHYKEADGVTQTIFHPDRSDLRSTLLAANASLVHLLGLAHEFMGMVEYEAEMRDLLLQWTVSRNELGLQ
jgi:Family of unknown function (DUF5677)